MHTAAYFNAPLHEVRETQEQRTELDDVHVRCFDLTIQIAGKLS